MVASALGLAGGMIMNYIVGLNLGKVVETAPAGFVVGTMQWLLVLRWQIQRAGWWVAASTVGWAIGVLLVWTEFVNWTFGGAIYGAITGIALILLLPPRIPVAGKVVTIIQGRSG